MPDGDQKKEGGSPRQNQRDPIVYAAAAIFILLFVAGAVQQITSWATNIGAIEFFQVEVMGLYINVLPLLQILSIVFSAVLVAVIIVINRKIAVIRMKEKERYQPIDESGSLLSSLTEKAPDLTNPRWKKVQEFVESENQSDWKQAILEADIMLEEMLAHMGYVGAGVGERLQQIEHSDFPPLEAAWEAHKARNIIAHEGASYQLTLREARRVIDLYRQVFEEFHYI
ncbi:MAG: hypothetical protein WDZ82_00760 [Candidatus Paceibacterota bacterium]